MPPVGLATYTLETVGTPSAPSNPWLNPAMRWRMFFLLLGVTFALLAGLVLLIHAWRSGVRDSVTTTSTGGPGAAAPAPAPPAGSSRSKGVRLVRVGSFDSPLYVTAPPGDKRRVFVVGQNGQIWVLVGGKRRARPFLNLSGDISSGGERGLLSMAFAPDYAKTGRFYVDFTDRNGDTRIQEFRRSRNPNVANRGSRRQILFIRQPYPNHNGGLLLFGPDHYLYVGMGDGGSAGDPQNRAQNLDSLLGKLLRIDPRPGASLAPASNPFVGRPGRDEVYAYGLRNPWRFSFDSRTGDLYIGDVGQNAHEEIDYARRGAAAGRDYGWSCFEGKSRYDPSRSCPNPTPPVLDYGHGAGECSVTGGVVVRDRRLPALYGRYLYGDFCVGQVRSFKIKGGSATGDRATGLSVPSLSSFGQDARGRVYATSLNGPVYRLISR